MSARTEQHGPWEIRYDDAGDLDEIVGLGALHLERMDDGHIWIGFGTPGTVGYLHLNIFSLVARRGKIGMRVEKAG